MSDAKNVKKNAKESKAPVETKAPVKETKKSNVTPKDKVAPVEAKKATEVASTSPAVLCLVRVRGAHGMRRNILDTLKLLSLHSVNHAVVVQETESIHGMINKVKDYIAYGTIDADTLTSMMKKRGILVGNQPLTDEHVQHATDYKNIGDLAKAIISSKIKVREIRGLKPVFRLHPPKGGYTGSIKKSIQAGGILGNHGANINKMLRRMI